jgi:hypothetical protein
MGVQSKSEVSRLRLSLFGDDVRTVLAVRGSLRRALRFPLAHLRFVTIRPFEDGNGRIARAIADWLLTKSENKRAALSQHVGPNPAGEERSTLRPGWSGFWTALTRFGRDRNDPSHRPAQGAVLGEASRYSDQ